MSASTRASAPPNWCARAAPGCCSCRPTPDLNPIEMAFLKLKALLCKKAARTFDAIAIAIGDICDLFDPQRCRSFLKSVGYEAD